MIRFLIAFFVCVGVLQAVSFTYPDFRQCYKKNKKAFVYFGDTRAIAVSKNLAIAYSKTKPSVEYVKFDPFLNLYLFHSSKPLSPVRLRSSHLLKIGEWVAGMDENSLFVGNFAKHGDLLDSFYLKNAKLEANSMISCLCCEMYGIGVGGGSFIGSEYIKRFIKLKDVYYGDIGVRFEQVARDFLVKSINPFYPNQLLRIGDKIQKIDGKKVTSLKQLNQAVLFSKPKNIIKIEVLRDNKKLTLSSVVRSRMGGGKLSDSFLEKKGIFFDTNLRIVKVNNNSFGDKSGLKVGDKLMQIDGKTVKAQDDIRVSLSKLKSKKAQLLFDRDDFQFFVKLGL